MESVVTLSGPAPHPEFWRGKRVLLTGHTGFKGGWLAIWLQRLGAHVAGIALPPATEPNLFTIAKVEEGMENHYCDINERRSVIDLVRRISPEIVFHMAAQPLVRVGYKEPVNTFSTNIMGTVHLLEALRGLDSVRVAMIVTTDKVYRNREWVYPYREDDALGGNDPYSASKAASEIVTACYRDAFLGVQGAAVSTARAGNVIGGGDWSLDRLIPDAVRAWQSKTPLFVRRPAAIRPWQHVLDPLAGYLTLAERMWTDASMAGAWNFGPETHQFVSVREVVLQAQKSYGYGDIHWGEETEGPHEAGRLTLDTSKVRSLLALRPRWTLEEAIDRTMFWYRSRTAGVDARQLCEDQIQEYEGAA